MAKKNSNNQNQKTDNLKDNKLSNKKKKKLTAVILSSALGGGALGLGGWHAQAHGNRSSHNLAEIRWAPKDYVIKKSEYLFPDTVSTRSLQKLTADLADIKNLETIKKETLKSLENYNIKNLDEETLELKELNDETDKIMLEKTQLEKSLELNPLTRRVMNFFKDNNLKGAITAIEEQKDQYLVLSGYIWVQMDLYNLGMVNGHSTPKYLEEIITISEAGIKYALPIVDKYITAKKSAAALLNNLASFSLPDKGEVTSKQMEKGRNAAIKALELRKELGEPAPIMRANWMVGLHYFKADNLQMATKYFRVAINQAEKLNDREDVAWGKLYLGLSIRLDEKAHAIKLITEARGIFYELGNIYAVNHLDEIKGQLF